MLRTGVVEVLPGGIDFDRLGARAIGEFQQPWVQALVEKQVRGNDSQHSRCISRIRRRKAAREAILIVSFWRQKSAGAILRQMVRGRDGEGDSTEQAAVKLGCKLARLKLRQACIPTPHRLGNGLAKV